MMAKEKVGIYRNYYGPIPQDRSGMPLPKSKWPDKRAHSWVVRWFGSDGQRYSKSVATRKEAERLAEEVQADVRVGKGDLPEEMTLKAFGDMYLKIRTGLSERSQAEHERTLKFLRERLGDTRLMHKITPLDARQFISWYRRRTTKGKPLSPATSNKVLRECRRIFREAVDCNLIRQNPFERIKQERVSEPPWHHVTPDEYQRLISAAPSLRWQGMIALAYCCGLRVGEILNLTWRDIDFAVGRLRVVAKRGEAEMLDWSPKDKDMRVLPIPAPAINLLTKLQLDPTAGQVYLFVRGKGPQVGQRMARNNIWRDFNAIRRKAGLPLCSMHDLRRSFCTNLSRAIPMHVVQELAGHSDIRTTRRYYVQVEPELMKAACRVVETALEEAGEAEDGCE
jgi:integrase